MNKAKNLAVKIAGVTFKNPVMTASGTFTGEAFTDLWDISALGALVTKGVSADPWPGNETPRVAETHGGMLNAIGLQNDGVEAFIEVTLPYLSQFKTNIIVNICGKTVDEYVAVAEALDKAKGVSMLELNISCPNIKAGGMAFGTDPSAAASVVEAVKKAARQPLIVKLSPNVTDIAAIAQAAEAAGANALSLINTLLGMKIDIHRRKPLLANVMGGLSGPAVKPVAVRMVYQVARAVNIPVIGMGGIATGEDAVEFLLAGAAAVAVGSASFANPNAAMDVLAGIERYMDNHGITDVNELKMIVEPA